MCLNSMNHTVIHRLYHVVQVICMMKCDMLEDSCMLSRMLEEEMCVKLYGHVCWMGRFNLTYHQLRMMMGHMNCVICATNTDSCADRKSVV